MTTTIPANAQLTNLLPKHFEQALSNTAIDKLTSLGTEQELWLLPPLVDLCARLREPGLQQHGTLASEGRAARANGFLHVVIPPDTNPILENGSLLKGLRERALDDGGIYLHILGALTEGLKGNNPSNIAGLKKGGCIAVSNARQPFANDLVLLRTLEYAATFGMKVFFYPDEPSLSGDGVAHEGYIASYHGLQGIPWIAETVALSTQLLMVEETGIAAHFSQLSCKSSVELMRWAKNKKLPVTCDVAMHQLYLTDDNLEGFNSMAYVLPPLRSNTDQKALRRGLKDGTIDAICSHHEPLNATAKKAPFAESTPGISNFDTFMALACQLVRDEVLSREQLVDKICLNPARIAGINEQYASIGGAVLIDPNVAWQVTNDTMHSNGKNTPFFNQCLQGRVVETFFD